MKESSPASPKERLESLDLLRGIALFGILVVNCLQYFQPLGLANAPIRFVPGDDAMWPIWGVIRALFDMKFLTVFSLLFGLGFALQWEKAQQLDGKAFKWLYLRRLLILLLFGVLHGVLLYAADVLVVYALAGLILIVLASRDQEKLMRGGFILLMMSVSIYDVLESPNDGLAVRPILLYWAAFIGVMLLARRARAPIYVFLGLFLTAGGSVLHHSNENYGYAPGADYQLARELAQKQSTVDLHASLDRGVIEVDGRLESMPATAEVLDRAYQRGVEAPELAFLSYAAGDFGMAVRARVDDFLNILLFGLVYFGWRTLGLFLIAAGLMRWGLAAPRNEDLWRRAMSMGLGIGLPVSIAATFAWGKSHSAENALTAFVPILHDLSSLFIASGLVGAAFLWGASERFRFLKSALCNVGRVALSNYLGQSLIMSLLAGGYGLGWYGRLSHLELMVLAVVAFALLTAISSLWLTRYRYGPLEWLWRCGTYRAWLPNRVNGVRLL